MNREEFGKWVKQLRKECDMTQERLALMLGYDHSQSIANIESGRTPLPFVKYRDFIKIFDLDPEKFINVLLSMERSKIEKSIFQLKK